MGSATLISAGSTPKLMQSGVEDVLAHAKGTSQRSGEDPRPWTRRCLVLAPNPQVASPGRDSDHEVGDLDMGQVGEVSDLKLSNRPDSPTSMARWPGTPPFAPLRPRAMALPRLRHSACNWKGEASQGGGSHGACEVPRVPSFGEAARSADTISRCVLT